MEAVIKIILLFAATKLAFFLSFPLASLLFSFTKSKIRPPKPTSGQETDFACIITAYQNIDIARELVLSLLGQKYGNFHIYLVADDVPNFQIPPNQKLTIIKPATKLGSKVKSLRLGLESFIRPHEAIVVFDPDNLAHPYFLTEINRFFQAGYKAVQGQRVAKNLDTKYACMDALGEYFYNYSSRAVPFRLGASATISGSAMAIDTKVYQDYLAFMEKDGVDKVIVAEDKILQIYLVDHKYTIAYAEQAFVFDEKVSSGGQVTRQRTRWLNAWFKHTRHGVNTLLKGLITFNFNRLYSGYLNVYPPLFMLVLSTVLFFLASLLFAPEAAYILALGLACFALNFYLSLVLNNTPKQVMDAFFSVPLFVFNQVLALLQIKKSDKDFMATTHTQYLGIDEVLSKTTHTYKP